MLARGPSIKEIGGRDEVGSGSLEVINEEGLPGRAFGGGQFSTSLGYEGRGYAKLLGRMGNSIMGISRRFKGGLWARGCGPDLEDSLRALVLDAEKAVTARVGG